MKVSVIMPCYNVEKYVANSVQSVLNQTYSDLELICIDDGSTDNTLLILRQLQSESPMQMYVISQTNSGAPVARNTGIESSKGQYLQFLDADDILDADKIEHQVRLAQENGLPDLIIGSYARINEKGRTLFEKTYTQEYDYQNYWTNLLKTNLGHTSSNLFKSNFFKSGGKWNTAYKSSQEYELMFQLLKTTDKIVFDPHVKTKALEREEGSISKTNLNEKWQRYVLLRVDIINYLKSKVSVFDFQSAYQTLFDAIRMLYPYNKTKALSIYNEHIPKEFKAKKSLATSSYYIYLYRILGFKRAQQLTQLRNTFRK
jgi:glycosyltransferase involved in cell wall biosynthesis